MDMGDDPAWRHDGIGDPSILVDRGTGTIWVAALWSHGDRVGMDPPGLAPEETGQFMLVRSDDDGLTWSSPIDITTQCEGFGWSLMLQGPGKGITMADGTLVFLGPVPIIAGDWKGAALDGRVVQGPWSTWHVPAPGPSRTPPNRRSSRSSPACSCSTADTTSSPRVVMLSDDLGRLGGRIRPRGGALVEPWRA